MFCGLKDSEIDINNVYAYLYLNCISSFINTIIVLTDEVFLQASIFHELCDNTEGFINRAHSIQPDQVLMLKLLHDLYLCLNIRADDCKKHAK